MKSLAIAVIVVIVSLVPAVSRAQEQEYVTLDVSYGANLIDKHGFVSGFDYPQKPTMTTGKSYDSNGIGVAAKVAITDVVSVNGRFEHVGLRNAQFFIDDRQRYQGGNVPGLQTEPDFQAAGGSANYWEISGSFNLPKTHGHSLVVGTAKENFSRDFYSSEIGGPDGSFYTINASHLGLVVGGEGKQKFGKVTLDYAGRLYPKMARRDYQSSGNGTYSSPDSSSFGFEVRGTATWMFAEHVGLTGGYEFRRLRTEMAPKSSWPINENQDSKLVLAGIRVGF